MAAFTIEAEDTNDADNGTRIKVKINGFKRAKNFNEMSSAQIAYLTIAMSAHYPLNPIMVEAYKQALFGPTSTDLSDQQP